MGARVVGAGGIGAVDDLLATVVGSCAGGRWGLTVGAATDVWTASALAVAGKTGAGCAVVVSIELDNAGAIAVGTGVVDDV